MKKTVLLLSALLIWACTPGEKPVNDKTPEGQTPGGSIDTPGGDDNTDDPGTTVGVDPSTLPDEPWFSTNYWDRTDAQKMGFRGKVKSFTEKRYYSSTPYIQGGSFDTPYTDYEQYEFREDGNLSRMTAFEGDNNIKARYTFEYDSEGRLSDMKYYDNFTSEPAYPTSTYHYEYDNPGKRVAYFADNWKINGSTYTSDFSYWSIPSLVNGLSEVVEDRWAAPDAFYKTVVRRTYKFEGADKLIATVENSWWTADDPDNKSSEILGPYELTYSGGYPVSSTGSSATSTWFENGMMASYTIVYTFPAATLTTTWYDNPYMVCPKSYTGGPDGPFGAIFWDYTYSSAWEKTGQKASYWTSEQVPAKEGVTYTYQTIDGVEYVINTNSWTDYVWDSNGNWISRTESMEPAAQPGEPHLLQYRRTIEYY